MNTDLLLIRRIVESPLLPADYIDWATDMLCANHDSPSLRILAGLSPRHQGDEVEPYFLKACKELKIEHCINPSSGEFLNAIERQHAAGQLSASDAIRFIARTCVWLEYDDPLLSIFVSMDEELSMMDDEYHDVFYPSEALRDLDAALLREFKLHHAALELNPPKGHFSFIKCCDCGHIGPSTLITKSKLDYLKSKIPGPWRPPAKWPACEKCESLNYKSLANPDIREEYYRQMKANQSLERTAIAAVRPTSS